MMFKKTNYINNLFFYFIYKRRMHIFKIIVHNLSPKKKKKKLTEIKVIALLN